jgi:hypothetical protein
MQAIYISFAFFVFEYFVFEYFVLEYFVLEYFFDLELFFLYFFDLELFFFTRARWTRFRGQISGQSTRIMIWDSKISIKNKLEIQNSQKNHEF